VDRISRRLATVAALVAALILSFAWPGVALAEAPSPTASAKPAGCVKAYSRADFHRVARKAMDGKWRSTKHERRTLNRVQHCQRHAASRPVLKKHRARYLRSHRHRMYIQGVGRFNRVYPAHTCLGASCPYPFIVFGDVRRIFEAAGASPREAYIFATITRGESGGGLWGGYPGILGYDGRVVPGATSVGVGLVQNTPKVWCCVAWAYYVGLGGSSTNTAILRNPLITAQMAYALYQFAGASFGPWYGTRYYHDPGSNVSSSLTKADVRFIRLGGMDRLRTR
jgi:hypothetical protein